MKRILFAVMFLMFSGAKQEPEENLIEIGQKWSAQQVLLSELLDAYEEKLVVLKFDKLSPTERLRHMEIRFELLRKAAEKDPELRRGLEEVEKPWKKKMILVDQKLQEFEKFFDVKPVPGHTIGERIAYMRANLGLAAAIEALKQKKDSKQKNGK